MLSHEIDPETGAHYFRDTDDKRDLSGVVWQTEELGVRTVVIDYDSRGNIVGIEVL